MFRVSQYLGKPIFTTLCVFFRIENYNFAIFYLHSKLNQLTTL